MREWVPIVKGSLHVDSARLFRHRWPLDLSFGLDGGEIGQGHLVKVVLVLGHDVLDDASDRVLEILRQSVGAALHRRVKSSCSPLVGGHDFSSHWHAWLVDSSGRCIKNETRGKGN